MSWLVIGTVSFDDFPLTYGSCSLAVGGITVGGRTVPINRGTSALLGSACKSAQALGIRPPKALLVGDTGKGKGSINLYRHLVENFNDLMEGLMVFHYLQPEVDWHNRILLKMEDLDEKPVLVADAGYMYVAKMSGFAASYDLFTPDAGEMAFLADESAPHPFYTRGFLLHDEEAAPDLVQRAYINENAARYLLVKGRVDHVASRTGIIQTISEPSVPNMEPIGGTGDTLTGIVSALIASGKAVPDAAISAARVNRVMGFLSNPTPAFRVLDLFPALPRALEIVLKTA